MEIASPLHGCQGEVALVWVWAFNPNCHPTVIGWMCANEKIL